MSIATRILLNNALDQLSSLYGQGRIASMSKNFRGSSDWMSLIIVVSCLAAGIAGIWLAHHYWSKQEGKAFKCPNRLFRDLCRCHGLSWHDASLLKKLAIRRQLESPLDIFVNPDALDLQDTVMQERVRGQLDSIRQKLFGDLAA